MGSKAMGPFWVKLTIMSHNFFRLVSACGLILLLAGGSQGKPAANAAPSAAGGGRITAAFDGLQGRTGYLRVSLFNANGFPDGVPLARRDISLQALGAKTLASLKITFGGLKPGTYAVCAFHDRNGSGKLTQNFLGIPQEEWGMSGNPHPRYRAPRFGEAKIGLNPQEEKTTFIILHT